MKSVLKRSPLKSITHICNRNLNMVQVTLNPSGSKSIKIKHKVRLERHATFTRWSVHRSSHPIIGSMSLLNSTQIELVQDPRCSSKTTTEIDKTTKQLKCKLHSNGSTRVQAYFHTLTDVGVGSILWLPPCCAVLAAIESVKVDVSCGDGNSCADVG